MSEMQHLCEMMRRSRERHGWTQGELGRLVEASQQAVSGWEAGRSIPDPAAGCHQHVDCVPEVFDRVTARMGQEPDEE